MRKTFPEEFRHGASQQLPTPGAGCAFWLPAARAPLRQRFTDISEQHTGEGNLYLFAIKDLHSNRIVGYSMNGRMQVSLAIAALDHAEP